MQNRDEGHGAQQPAGAWDADDDGALGYVVHVFAQIKCLVTESALSLYEAQVRKGSTICTGMQTGMRQGLCHSSNPLQKL